MTQRDEARAAIVVATVLGAVLIMWGALAWAAIEWLKGVY